MLMFELDDWEVLKKIFTNISEIIDEVSIECHVDKLKFKAIDRSHVCFFECIIHSGLFDKYVLLQEFYLYIDLDELIKVLKRGNKKDILVFKADYDEFHIIFENKNKREFSLTQLDSLEEARELPVMDYDVSFECNFDFLKNALKDADLYSDRLKFSCSDYLLILSCEGRNGNYSNEYTLDDSFVDCSSSYSIGWLFKVLNTKLSSNDLKINMGQDYPMLIEMNMDFVELKYLIAPRLGE